MPDSIHPCTDWERNLEWSSLLLIRAGSSMRLVRLKPQGSGPGPRPVEQKFTK